MTRARDALLAALRAEERAAELALLNRRIARVSFLMEHPASHTMSAGLLRALHATLIAERDRLESEATP